MKHIKLFEQFVSEGIEINNLNPTAGLFVEYSPEKLANAKLGKNMVTLDVTCGGKPNDIITVYRGTIKTQTRIVPGDYVTTNKQLAKVYAGTGHVIELKVRKADVIDDKTEPCGEEYLYIPGIDKKK